MSPARTAAEPEDQAIRDAAIADLETSIFMHAGAGTGKTSVLVGRLVQTVRSGKAELREIVAITFTEKAAGELRNRVRHALYTALRSADITEAARLRRALTQVDGAHIETIHAFASALLRERPLEAGVHPNFSVMDNVGEQLAFEQEWEDWLWSEEEGSAPARIERCLRLGLSLTHMRDLAHTIGEFRDLNPLQAAPPVPPPRDTLRDRRERIARLETLAAPVSAAAVALVERVRETSQALDILPDALLEADLVNLRLPTHRLGRGQGADRIRFLQAWQEFSDKHAAYAETVREQALAAFIEVASTFVGNTAQARLQRGTLNFQDLLIEASNLLEHNRDVRRYFRRRFHVLFIDEFQDTDPLQAKIVLLLAAADETADWRDAVPAPGRLFIVGDPKQSIYRFRRADIDIYGDVERVYREAAERAPGGTRVDTLRVNFRSRPGLVEWQNQIFSTLIQSPPDFPKAQPPYQHLSAFRTQTGPAVVVLRPNTGVEWRRIGEARQDEAGAIARWINAVVRSDDFPARIPDPDAASGDRRPRYRDIAVLVRTRTALELYTAALDDAGVPYHLDSGRGFFLQQEVRDAAAVLMALDDTSDEVSVVAALKSAPFGVSDLDLLEFHNAGGNFRLEPSALPVEYQGALRDPLEQLLRLRAEMKQRTLPDFVDHVLRETHLMEIQLARGSTRRAANLQIIVQRATDFAANGMESLRTFTRWLGSQTRADLAEAESPVTEVDDDVVRILTVHQAKGLEFPMVILAKLAAGDLPDRRIAVINREQERIDFQVGPRERRFSTPGFAEARQRQEVYEESEERRLLYVATTRARDWLVIPIFFTTRTLGYHRILEEALPGWLNPDAELQTTTMLTCRVEELPHVPAPTVAAIQPNAEALLHDWESAHSAALVAGGPLQEVVTPSSLGHDLPKLPRESEPPVRSADAADPAFAGEDGRALATTDTSDALLLDDVGSDGLARGTLIHDALAFADLDDWARTEKRTRDLCTERGMDAEAEPVVEHVRTAFHSTLFDRARRALRTERELPLVNVEAERIWEGYVDLAFEEDGGWVIVDYKTDRDPSAETLDGYAQQVRAYVEMLQATHATVREAWLLFTAGGDARPVPIPD